MVCGCKSPSSDNGGGSYEAQVEKTKKSLTIGEGFWRKGTSDQYMGFALQDNQLCAMSNDMDGKTVEEAKALWLNLKGTGDFTPGQKPGGAICYVVKIDPEDGKKVYLNDANDTTIYTLQLTNEDRFTRNGAAVFEKLY